MGGTTFYLKYRPQRIKELDLPEIREGLLRIAKSGKFPHALLFVGPRGTGKTSAARIFAKVVNCQNLSKGEPCNKCNACREITAGNALDVIEIDAASNRGVDDIRDLREKIKLSPVRFRYKVYIIDEVHMLTIEAFNALLKTLEEPPSHAIFILCTTEPEKLPETIVSRCMRFNFRKAKPEEIVFGSLRRVLEGEKIEVEKGVLEEIAKRVDGSFRDAHKILEQLAIEEGGKITLRRTKEFLGQIEDLSPDRLLLLLKERNTKAALEELNRVVQRGGDLEIYVQRILERLREYLLARVGIEKISSEEWQRFTIEEIKILINSFSEARNKIRFSPIIQLPVEVAIVEWCEGEKKEKHPQKLEGLEKNTEKLGKTKSRSPKENTYSNSETNKEERNTRQVFKQIQERWEEILTKIKPQNHSVEALLKASRPKDYKNEFLILEVFYKFHKERLETEKCRQIVERTVEEIVGAPIKLKCVLGEKPSGRQPIKKGNEDFDILEVANSIFNGKIES